MGPRVARQFVRKALSFLFYVITQLEESVPFSNWHEIEQFDFKMRSRFLQQMNTLILMAFSASVAICAGMDSKHSKWEGGWHYEGVIGDESTARLCYKPPFSFEELQGIDWYLAIEETTSSSCLEGRHPEALSSLWQISPESDVWVKRQGQKLAIVTKNDGTWGVQKLLSFPEGVESPSTAIVWCNSDQLFALNSGHIWTCSFDGIWIRETENPLALSGMLEKGFVQSQHFLYHWGETASCLIDKNSGVIRRYLDDSWPQLLKEFGKSGAVWQVDGDYVDVALDQQELQFDLARKLDFSNDLAFEGLTPPDQMDVISNESSYFGGSAVPYVLGGMFLFFLGGILGFLIRGNELKSTQAEGRGAGIGVLKSEMISGIGTQSFTVSDGFQKLVEMAPHALSTMEFDEIIQNDENLSPESQRSKRAKAIRLINAESQLVFGFALIERTRDPIDRRKVLYKLRSIPERIREQVIQLRESEDISN